MSINVDDIIARNKAIKDAGGPGNSFQNYEDEKNTPGFQNLINHTSVATSGGGLASSIGAAFGGVPGAIVGALGDSAIKNIFLKQAQSMHNQGKDLSTPEAKNELFAKTTMLANPATINAPSGESYQLPPQSPGAPPVYLGTDPQQRAEGLQGVQAQYQTGITGAQEKINTAFDDYKKASQFNETDFIAGLKKKIQGTDDLDKNISDIEQKMYAIRPELLKKYAGIQDPDKKEALIRNEENMLQNEIVDITKLKVDRQGTIDEIINSAKDQKKADIEVTKLAYEKAQDEYRNAVDQYQRGVGSYKDVVEAADSAKKMQLEDIKNNDEYSQIYGIPTLAERSDGIASGQRWLDRSISRTDRHNNPTAIKAYPQFIDTLKKAGLVEGVDFWKGDDTFGVDSDSTPTIAFKDIDTGIKGNIALIDQIGFYTKGGQPRWGHTAYSPQQWNAFTPQQKAQVIAKMYQSEGGKGDFQAVNAPGSSGGAQGGGIFDKLVSAVTGKSATGGTDIQKQKDLAEIKIITAKVGGSEQETKDIYRQLISLYNNHVPIDEIRKIANSLTATKKDSGSIIDKLKNPGGTQPSAAPSSSFFGS